jgi:hypothetical protein
VEGAERKLFAVRKAPKSSEDIRFNHRRLAAEEAVAESASVWE